MVAVCLCYAIEGVNTQEKVLRRETTRTRGHEHKHEPWPGKLNQRPRWLAAGGLEGQDSQETLLRSGAVGASIPNAAAAAAALWLLSRLLLECP